MFYFHRRRPPSGRPGSPPRKRSYPPAAPVFSVCI